MGARKFGHEWLKKQKHSSPEKRKNVEPEKLKLEKFGPDWLAIPSLYRLHGDD